MKERTSRSWAVEYRIDMLKNGSKERGSVRVIGVLGLNIMSLKEYDEESLDIPGKIGTLT
ncbi:hypothetical protein [Bacillus sp. SG-1]|uniref:hypothetical protein n=1 Tax=Bacillus sp. SG-1 TaxID=161544 RepID=UPI000154397C|nr:hypothetical protein [Bacillus sp. SG-1]EDL64961.1 hypothetical protein BSG1_14609 [Bacillus sp. SG-1]